MVDNDGSIAESIPIFLLNGEKSSCGFVPVEDNILSHLSSCSHATSTNSTYNLSHYDILTNSTLNH